MAGRGPRPKDASRRARANKDTVEPTIIRFVKGEQPDLPERIDGPWCEATLDWWKRWGDAAQSEHFTATDWDFLADTALLHHQAWAYLDTDALPELRLRVAKFGATMEDRARLRIQFAEADEADSKRPKPESSRAKYGPLTAVPDSKSG